MPSLLCWYRGLIEHETGFLVQTLTRIHLYVIRPLVSSVQIHQLRGQIYFDSRPLVDNRWSHLSLSLRDFLREAEQRICFPRNDKVIFETDPSVSYIIVPTSALINSRLARSKQRSKRNSPPRSLPLSLVSVQLLAVFIRAHVRMARLCVRSRKNRGAGFNRALVFGVNETGRPMLRGGKEIEWTKRGNGERERDPNGAHHGDPSVHRYRSLNHHYLGSTCFVPFSRASSFFFPDELLSASRSRW